MLMELYILKYKNIGSILKVGKGSKFHIKDNERGSFNRMSSASGLCIYTAIHPSASKRVRGPGSMSESVWLRFLGENQQKFP